VVPVPSHLYLSLACLNCRIILRAKPRYRRNAVEDSKTQPREAQYTAASQSQPDTNSTPSDAAADDWASDSTDDDDWDFDEDADKTRNVSSQKMSALQPMKSAANPRAAPDLVRFTPQHQASLRVLAAKLSPSMMDYRVPAP